MTATTRLVLPSTNLAQLLDFYRAANDYHELQLTRAAARIAELEAALRRYGVKA